MGSCFAPCEYDEWGPTTPDLSTPSAQPMPPIARFPYVVLGRLPPPGKMLRNPTSQRGLDILIMLSAPSPRSPPPPAAPQVGDPVHPGVRPVLPQERRPRLRQGALPFVSQIVFCAGNTEPLSQGVGVGVTKRCMLGDPNIMEWAFSPPPQPSPLRCNDIALTTVSFLCILYWVGV